MTNFPFIIRNKLQTNAHIFSFSSAKKKIIQVYRLQKSMDSGMTRKKPMKAPFNLRKLNISDIWILHKAPWRLMRHLGSLWRIFFPLLHAGNSFVQEIWCALRKFNEVVESVPVAFADADDTEVQNTEPKSNGTPVSQDKCVCLFLPCGNLGTMIQSCHQNTERPN